MTDTMQAAEFKITGQSQADMVSAVLAHHVSSDDPTFSIDEIGIAAGVGNPDRPVRAMHAAGLLGRAKHDNGRRGAPSYRYWLEDPDGADAALTEWDPPRAAR